MTILYFVRHAHSVYNSNELRRPLSNKGAMDSISVCELLKNERVDHIISSPYRRAVETVETLSIYLKKEIVIEESLRERTLSEEPVEDFNYAVEQVWKNVHFSWEGGESNIQAQLRGVQAILHILNKYEGERVVVSTHGNIMVLMMNYFDSTYGFDFWKQLDMPDIYKLTFEGEKMTDVEHIWTRQ
ncbi:2,3-bisphosphoglycerate-dependent phosphoglycerate mutase [Peribacillus deserti]|uniref:2,3-bisphosphoglycerate-dependent phosphoglycerate mutase n=1 Tax=Peribacillus deserti TaxID=673318 RepID=A0ABS2QD75_9BACI|nr:histidine phosphatase family protein [Peribacillus deserti]MBM7691047.1 2,3-bisphosphoglycerate-dependent phosphoglycerate mutase [Peribacillus deserti]